MRLPIVLISLAVAAAAVVDAATGGGNPQQLALKRALQANDFLPAKVEPSLLGPAGPAPKTQDSLGFIGKGLYGADYNYTWKPGGTVSVPGLGATDKEWHVFGDVFIAPSAVAAKQLFADGRAAEHGFFADFGTEQADSLKLPRYGDEQLALVAPDAGGPHAMVFVRKGNTVWELSVGHSPPKWIVTKAQIVELLKTYAHKQSTRVGAG
jgi:hypothetical protein